jgi:hypothetical protein
MNVHLKNILPEQSSSSKEGMAVLVFKTNLQFKKDVALLEPVLNQATGILRWNVDRQDIDHVLRIETTCLVPQDIIQLVTNAGYHCEELPD